MQTLSNDPSVLRRLQLDVALCPLAKKEARAPEISSPAMHVVLSNSPQGIHRSAGVLASCREGIFPSRPSVFPLCPLW